MPDPFEALRISPTPIEPDRAFAARLRVRVLQALRLAQGDLSMTLQDTDTSTSSSGAARDQLRPGDISYFSLWVRDVERAAAFFGNVLGWRYGAPGPGDTRLVEGVTIQQGIAGFQSAGDFMRGLGVPLPRELGPTAYPVFAVNDINARVERVRTAGGWAGVPAQEPYGLVAACLDDQGMPFSLHEVPAGMPAPRPPATGAHQGDIAYLVFETPDSGRARAFFESVFGLQFTPGRSPDGWNVADMAPMSGLAGGHPRSTIVPMYRVDDIEAAVARVRAAGGDATDPVRQPYGWQSVCTDDQGTRFMLGQF